MQILAGVSRRLMPKELQPPWYLQAGLVGSFVFFLGISAIALNQHLGGLFD